MPQIIPIQLRRGVAAQWSSANPILLEGEQAFETDTKRRKIGDGATVYNSLPFDDVKIDLFTFGVSIVENKTFTIVLKVPFGGIITEVTTQCASGTSTATIKINNVNLGGAANAVSSTLQNQAHGIDNEFATGDKITVTFSANSACLDADASISYVRNPDLGADSLGFGTATLAWIAPERDGDNAALTDLSGYRIYKSTDSEAGTFSTYTLVKDITNETTLTHTVTGLPVGTWHFWMTAYDSAGNEGNAMYFGSKTI